MVDGWDDVDLSDWHGHLACMDANGHDVNVFRALWAAEHIVARSEAHDSGLCAADSETRREFASDPLNFTLASPAVNRSQKSGKDAAEWLPDCNMLLSRVNLCYPHS